MFEGMKTLNQKKSMARIPGELPLLFVAGADDPVGAYGRNVRKVYEKYREAGLKNVSLKLYDGCRHEILNESIRGQVYKELYGWCEKCLKKR